MSANKEIFLVLEADGQPITGATNGKIKVTGIPSWGVSRTRALNNNNLTGVVSSTPITVLTEDATPFALLINQFENDSEFSKVEVQFHSNGQLVSTMKLTGAKLNGLLQKPAMLTNNEHTELYEISFVAKSVEYTDNQSSKTGNIEFSNLAAMSGSTPSMSAINGVSGANKGTLVI